MPQPSIRISQATRYQNAALNYYLSLTDSPYLHYGYWETQPKSAEDLTIANLCTAQAAYTQKLMAFIPEGTHAILDVGCGTGGNATYLLDRGFTVEGLAPDTFQQERFLAATSGRAPFHLSRFEDFKTSHPFDLVLLSESSQYMSAQDIAQGAARGLKQGGYLLLADMLRSDATYTEGIFSNCHVVEDLHQALLQSGFTLVKMEDISTQAAPTIEIGIDAFRRFGLSTVKYIADVIQIAVPPIYQLLRWAYKRWLQKTVEEGLQAGEIFHRHLCYQIQLWQLSAKDS
ncbi:class I SAM-dependent methyltransferase [Phormidium sp. CLA17]|uniref:class I SAM-dependent methyltransferase n=1 Tax=Leptolyngbya sp. Cla-17 TaxID=2803751 RepID=UPI001491DA9D|nr:class I SAM-dependent methyltransferase [Leptolyngbya sp. Cla-17]MBM0742443.1 class I SAM-dependent methyltransferase [Leptolyngbya sp. Cla-17]